ncbi:MAG: methylenetetrahydrofolate--tRNA-(uracil(54)-C(5))-methyltransferase (FADH(2)-oxidizing) TrmFO [Clostridia bacterium]
METKVVKIIGGGLAGCEACYQLLKRGVSVELYEMRPKKMTPCHTTEKLAELVCSNSLKSCDEDTASGTLKLELQSLDSLLLKCAKICAVPAGSALAVDRIEFSNKVTAELLKFNNFKLITEEVTKIDLNSPTIIATGPLTSDNFNKEILSIVEDTKNLHFYDAVAPIIDAFSIDYTKAFFAARYQKGEPTDYLNCAFSKEEYLTFYNELINAKCVETKNFEKNEIFESCMPLEVMAKRGEDTIRFGPLKPVGIKKEGSDQKFYAVLQLRKENKQATMYNIVGFQTNLIWGEQKRVIHLIPGLENAEILRYGVMHRNTFINAPTVINVAMQTKKYPNLFFAGQITGVEGYMESVMSGAIAGINMFNFLNDKPQFVPPITTITGALCNYITTCNSSNFQPMNSNFGVLPPLDFLVKDKKLRKKEYSKRANSDIIKYCKENLN